MATWSGPATLTVGVASRSDPEDVGQESCDRRAGLGGLGLRFWTRVLGTGSWGQEVGVRDSGPGDLGWMGGRMDVWTDGQRNIPYILSDIDTFSKIMFLLLTSVHWE